MNIAHIVLHFKNIGGCKNRLDIINGIVGLPVFHYFKLAFKIGVPNGQLEKKTVKLRVWQKLSARRAHMVLRGDNNKRGFERIGFAVNGYLTLLHSLKQGGLRFA